MPRLLRHQTFARNICNYFRALTKGAFKAQKSRSRITRNGSLLTPFENFFTIVALTYRKQ